MTNCGGLQKENEASSCGITKEFTDLYPCTYLRPAGNKCTQYMVQLACCSLLFVVIIITFCYWSYFQFTLVSLTFGKEYSCAYEAKSVNGIPESNTSSISFIL